MTVCSVYPSVLGGNAILSAPNYDRGLIYSVQIRLIYEHLYYKYFVRRSVGQATKGRNVKIGYVILSDPN